MIDQSYRIPTPALIALSGGRTSAYLLRHILDAYDGKLPSDIHVAFCNTGNEDEATLVFVEMCAAMWGIEVCWLEFDKDAPHRTRRVSFDTASRHGEPLEQIIQTRPTQHLFNPVSRYCSATAKARRMQKFMHEWSGYDKWFVALGLRADEPRRVEKAAKRAGRDREYPVMPLAPMGVTKEMVGEWWRKQPFDLGLSNVGGVTPMGNCVACPLKARGKLINILRVRPQAAEWPIRQEDEMTERIKNIPRVTRPRVVRNEADEIVDILPPLPDARDRFFKDRTSYRDLLAEASRLNAINAPLDEGYDQTIDCLCSD